MVIKMKPDNVDRSKCQLQPRQIRKFTKHIASKGVGLHSNESKGLVLSNMAGRWIYAKSKFKRSRITTVCKAEGWWLSVSLIIHSRRKFRATKDYKDASITNW